MKLIKKIKIFIGEYILKNKLKRIVRDKQVYNFDTAKRIAIVFNATDQKKYEKIRTFISFIATKKIQVSGLGFVNTDHVLDIYSYQAGCNFFTRKEINWYYIPKGKEVENFLSVKYDILIDLSDDDDFPIKFIAATSNASFKVGRFISKYNFYDLMIDISKNNTLEYLMNQVLHYLALINKKQ